MDIMTKEKARLASPLTLAYLGDSVYELLVREKITATGLNPQKLHQATIALVCAAYQSYAVELVLPLLTDDETDIYKRGRNANGNTVPKSSSPRDYRRATGLEALFGYLHMIGEINRICELFEVIYNGKENYIGKGKNTGAKSQTQD